MIVIDHMQDNRHTDESILDKIIRHFNTIQLNTFRYNKHFETMQNIMVHEHWEEWEGFVLAARHCESSMSKIHDNLISINTILMSVDDKSELEDKPNPSNEPYGTGSSGI